MFVCTNEWTKNKQTQGCQLSKVHFSLGFFSLKLSRWVSKWPQKVTRNDPLRRLPQLFITDQTGNNPRLHQLRTNLIHPYTGLFAVIKNGIVGKYIETWSYYQMRKTTRRYHLCKENACPHTQCTFTEKEPEECVPLVIFSGGTGSWKAFTLRAKLYFIIFLQWMCTGSKKRKQNKTESHQSRNGDT